MFAKIESRAMYGISAYRVDVEVDLAAGIRSFTIVGLPDAACRESSKRVMAALKNSGHMLPSMKITVNLAPAYLKKEGSIHDLAIALGVLTALNKIDKELLENKVACGELSLDGGLKPNKGALPIADGLKSHEGKILILPAANLQEASFIKKVRAIGVRNLNEAIEYITKGIFPLSASPSPLPKPAPKPDGLDFSDIKGNYNAKRALEIAVCGGHNILMTCFQYHQLRLRQSCFQ